VPEQPDQQPTTVSERLSERIRAATWDAHAGAEHTPFMQDLLGGRLAPTDYAQLAAQHHAIYTVLEDAADANTDPAIAPLLAPELRRLPALVADLEHLAGPEWVDALTITPATQAYCEQLRAVCFDWSGGLVAHHYVRYMGDLSGGLVIGRVVARVFELPDRDGTRFYQFDDIASPKATKEQYRQVLDELPWSDDEQTRVIDEILAAYRANTEVLLDLTPDVLERPHPYVSGAAVG
jgi:heme oxygenase